MKDLLQQMAENDIIEVHFPFLDLLTELVSASRKFYHKHVTCIPVFCEDVSNSAYLSLTGYNKMEEVITMATKEK